jgi:hypothetical protein
MAAVGLVLVVVAGAGAAAIQVWLEWRWRHEFWWDTTEFGFAHLEWKLGQAALLLTAGIGVLLIVIA